VLTRARAALAQSELEEPTDEELHELAKEYNGEPVEAMRAALQRWGRAAIEPVTVSERLPGPEDCDALGRCWWFCPASFLLENGMCAYWCLAPGYQVPPKTYWTHWLPHHALPVPSSQESTDA
jgi:hypothetical protein